MESSIFLILVRLFKFSWRLSVQCQLSLRVAELVKSFEQHREFPKVLTTSATVGTLIFNCNPPLAYQKCRDRLEAYPTKRRKKNWPRPPKERGQPSQKQIYFLLLPLVFVIMPTVVVR